MDEPKEEVLNDLDATDKEIIRLKYTNPKLSLSQIGDLLGVSKQVVHYRLKKPRLKEIFDELEKDVLLQLRELQAEAVLVFRKALRSQDLKIAVGVARDILMRALESPGMLPATFTNEILEFVEPQDG